MNVAVSNSKDILVTLISYLIFEHYFPTQYLCYHFEKNVLGVDHFLWLRKRSSQPLRDYWYPIKPMCCITISTFTSVRP